MTQGKFITLEGGEGAGKSTLSRRLAAFLQSHNIPVLLTREPGGTQEAEAIRALVVEGEKDRFDPITEALLFNAARQHHLKHSILPALQQGTWVICDRFVDSTFVYQGYVQGIDLAFLEKLHQDVCNNVFPDVTFLLDVPVDIGLYRAHKRLHNAHEVRFEQKGYTFHESIREAFLKLSKQYADRYCILDGTLPENAVFDKAINCLNGFLVS